MAQIRAIWIQEQLTHSLSRVFSAKVNPYALHPSHLNPATTLPLLLPKLLSSRLVLPNFKI